MFQAAIYYFLFVVIRGVTGGGNSTAYITVIIGSVFFFNYTRIAIDDGGRSIFRHKGLVLNAVFPRALLTVSEFYKGLLATWPALAIYAVIHVAFGAPITTAVLALPLLLVLQSAMNLGFALLFSTLTVYFKDMNNLLNYILRSSHLRDTGRVPGVDPAAQRHAAADLEPTVPAVLCVPRRHHRPGSNGRPDPRVHCCGASCW